MIATCEEFAKKHQITFNPTKSKLICFNACDAVTPHIICCDSIMTTDTRLLCYGLFTPGALHTITITIYCTCTCYIVPVGVILYYFEIYLCINIIDIIMSLHYRMINAI